MQLSDRVRIHARPHPLRPDVHVCEVAYGQTLAEILGNAHPNTYVYVGDALVPRTHWDRVRPKPGARITVKALAAGGDGDGNKVLRTVLQIAVVALSVYTGGLAGGLGTWAGAATAAAVNTVGNLVINALVPVQMPSPGLNGSAQDSSFNRKTAITGTRNSSNPYGPIPTLFGKHMLFPPWQAAPYTEVLGENQYLRGLLCLGYGPLDFGGGLVADANTTLDETAAFPAGAVRIGDTDFTDYDDAEFEIGVSPALYSGTVDEESLSLSWDTNAGMDTGNTRTTGADIDEISIDLTFPQGLFSIDDQGKTRNGTLEFEVEYREVGTGTWLAAVQASGVQYSASWIFPKTVQPTERLVRISGAARETRRAGMRWKVPAGQYEVRLTKRFESYTGTASEYGQAVWTALRGYTHEVPIQGLPDCLFMAFRIRATDQLGGVTDRINITATRQVQVWDEGTDTWSYQTTRLAAWQYLDPLIGVAAKGTAAQRNALRDNRVKKQEIKDWADDCAANGWNYDAVIDAPTTRFAMMRDIASVGRAAFDNHNGQYTVVRDVEQTVPTQMFTPRNSWGFSGSAPTTKIPHALRVWYTDPASGYQRREKIVYRTGYDDTNATDYTEIEARGVTDQVQAWRYGKYYLAELELRADTYTLNVDVENLVARRGDLVHVGTEIIRAGLGFGRVRSLVTDVNGDATEITLDETVTMEAGKTYHVRIRRADGTQAVQAVSTVAGDTDTLTLTAPVPDVAEKDLVAFMEVGEELLALKIKEILPGPDLTAQLRLKDAAPAIHDVDTATPPADDAPMSLVIDPAMIKCCIPVVDAGGARSDHTVSLPASGGIASPVIRVPVKHVEVTP